MDFHIIIPARLGSQRLPRKVLLEVNGKTLIQHVYENAKEANACSITIATDSDEIYETVKSFGAQACMTRSDHQSGTERLAEAVQMLNLAEDDIVVNVQGDEPLIPIPAIHQTVQALIDQKDASVSTLCTRIHQLDEILHSDVVKVILNQDQYALYFSRAPIPWDREVFDPEKNHYYRHIGLYTYRVSTLKRYQKLCISPLETVEHLEQLRLLWHREPIYVSIVEDVVPKGIDNHNDFQEYMMLIEPIEDN